MRIEDEPLSLRDFIRYSDERWAESKRVTDEILAELKAQQRALFIILDRLEEGRGSA